MALSNPAFPASQAFDAIQAGINENPKDKADAIKKANAVFAFTLKNKEGKTESWYVDLKKEGVVGKGDAPAGGKADGESISFLLKPRYSWPMLTALCNSHPCAQRR
jgi:hypothetical protein